MVQTELSSGRRKRWVAPAVALGAVLAFVMGEGVLRLYDWMTRTDLQDITFKSAYMFDPAVGLLHVPSTLHRSTSEFDLTITFNEEGFRSSGPFVDGTPEHPVAAVLGDSFAEALQVPREETFVHLLESSLTPLGVAQVQNYGVSSTGPPHYLQTYLRYAQPHNPSAVVACFFTANDICDSSTTLARSVSLRPQFERDASGKIVGMLPFQKVEKPLPFGQSDKPGPLFEGLRAFLGEHSAIYRHARGVKDKILASRPGAVMDKRFMAYEKPLRREYVEAYECAGWAISELADRCAEDGVRLVVVIIPLHMEVSQESWESIAAAHARLEGARPVQPDRVRNWAKRLCADLDVPCIDMTEALRRAIAQGRRVYFPRDGHLTAEGHKEVANELLPVLLQCFEPKLADRI